VRCLVSPRIAGWTCPHATITVTTTWPPPAAVTMAWCGCQMQPVYVGGPQRREGVTITARNAA
jgi:hypothetical protein